MIVFFSTSANVGAPALTSPGTTGLSASPAVRAVTRSSIARVPPSTPARSMPWIDNDSA